MISTISTPLTTTLNDVRAHLAAQEHRVPDSSWDLVTVVAPCVYYLSCEHELRTKSDPINWPVEGDEGVVAMDAHSMLLDKV